MHAGASYNLFSFLGFKHPFWFVDTHILLYMFIASMCAILLSWIMSRILLNFSEESLIRFSLCSIFEVLLDTIKDAIKKLDADIFSFIYGIFFFLIICNWLVLIPFLEEPTQNVNVTCAFALVAIYFIHKTAIIHNFDVYIHHWIKTPFDFRVHRFGKPFCWFESGLKLLLNGIITLLALPLELLGRMSLLLSLSFRLYGNIFGGSMISQLVHSFAHASLLYQIIVLVTGLNVGILGIFGLLEGFIQAYVFSLITINNIGLMMNEGQE